MSFNKENLRKFDGYLAEIKENCISCKNDISQEDYDKFFSYFVEVSKFLNNKENTSSLAMQNADVVALVAKCDEIILTFTKYFVAKRDKNRNERLKSASIVKEGMLAFKGDEKNSREAQHVLSLLKGVYFDRFEKSIEILNSLDDDKNTLEKLRSRFYQAKTPKECKVILWILYQRYNSAITDHIPQLPRLVASYSNIIGKQLQINSATTKEDYAPKAAFFGEKLESVVKQKDTMPHSPISRVQNLIGKFNK